MGASKANIEMSMMKSQRRLAQKKYNKRTILVVEDDSELRNFLVDHYEAQFNVLQADTGLAGLQIARDNNPDIIVTDIQIPNMNGFELCLEVRKNMDTSHIPIVILTGNTSAEQQIVSLSTGADAYLTKPFDLKLLDAMVSSLLANRKIIRNKYLGSETDQVLDKAFPKKDIDFILGLRIYIDENILNQALNVEMMSAHFGMSLTHVNRKIKSLTGLTPNNLIKSIRLKRAYKLIIEKGLRVSEAAYECGFSDPNYFTTCFKKEFGENPSRIVYNVKAEQIVSIKSGLANSLIDSNDNQSSLPLMLIADDNDEMRGFISNEFSSQFRIIEAADGETTLQMVIDELPSIVITDIVMPGLDGVELCRRIKTDDRTFHIPVILLSGKDSEEDTLLGLENGADDYIAKPFSITLLKARVKNLQRSRQLLSKRSLKKRNSPSIPAVAETHNDRFLKKATLLIEKYLADTDFNVNKFSLELGISRAQLYRKIDIVTGKSVHEFIKCARLNAAASFLTTTGLSISEVVEKVGFNSFAYFTKTFKEHFGVTPSNYKSNQTSLET